MSGDNSDGWMRQEEEVVARFALLNAKEDEEAREAVDNAEEIHEYELEGLQRDNPEKEEDVQEGSPDEVEDFETVEVVISTFTVEKLKTIARQCSVAVGGKKPLLFGRIRDCNNACITKIDETKFSYKEKVEKIRHHVPLWIILTPEKAGPIVVINMETGA